MSRPVLLVLLVCLVGECFSQTNTDTRDTLKEKIKSSKKLVAGPAALYHNKDSYILTVDRTQQVVEINKSNYREILNHALDLKGKDEDLWRMTYSKHILRAIVEGYNYDSAYNIKYVPYRKFGAIIGYTFAHLRGTTGSDRATANLAVPYMGVFTDLPITLSPTLYFTGEVNIAKYNAGLYADVSPTQNDFIGLGFTTLNVVPGLKFIRVLGRFRSYAKIGLMSSLQHVTPLTNVITTETKGTTVTVSEGDRPASANVLQMAASGGAGFEVSVKERKSIHFEFRYTTSLNNVVAPINLSFTNVGIGVGFNF